MEIDTTIPIYPLPEHGQFILSSSDIPPTPDALIVAVIQRPARCKYSTNLQGKALAFDIGSFTTKVGWAGEEQPRLVFRSQMGKPRHKATNELCTLVGEWNSALKGYDLAKHSFKDGFDSNVVVNYDVQEVLFDYAFDRLSITGGSVNHPILLTECPLNPVSCRAQMAELLFEAYGVPALHFAVDSVCVYQHNVRQSRCGANGLVVGVGHAASHVIPIVNGQPEFQYSSRLRVGGALMTDQLQKQLALRFPLHNAALSQPGVVRMLKEHHCYCALDYRAEIKAMQQDLSGAAGGRAVTIQLPWTPAKVVPQEQLAEEAARKAARAAENRQRLKDMAEAKRQRSLGEKEGNLRFYTGILRQVEGNPDPEEVRALLAAANVRGTRELQKLVDETTAAVRKMRGEAPATPPAGDGAEAEDEPGSELLNIPDDQLTPEQLKEKRRHKMLKGAREAREKVRLKKEAERREVEAQRVAEDAAFAADPSGYLEGLRKRQRDVTQRVDARKQRRLEQEAGKRGGSDQRQRMRLIAQQAIGGGRHEEDDSFGADDRDWDVYKAMEKGANDPELAAADDAEAAWLANRLKELGAPEAADGVAQEAAAVRPLSAQDFQVSLSVERVCIPELLFQPCMAGVDQAGLAELVATALARMPAAMSEACAAGALLITGGSAAFPGLDARLQAELRALRPVGHELRVLHSLDFVLDAWRGAAAIAARPELFQQGAISRAEYEEKGPDYLRLYAPFVYPFQ